MLKSEGSVSSEASFTDPNVTKQRCVGLCKKRMYVTKDLVIEMFMAGHRVMTRCAWNCVLTRLDLRCHGFVDVNILSMT